MKVPLRQEDYSCFDSNPRMGVVQWKSSLPFFVNRRGYMIHRVRSAASHLWDGEFSHSTVHYFCGNSGRIQYGDLYSDPPAERLLCELCELLAKKAGLPSADELAGRHVHVGKLRAERTCCNEKREAN